MGFVYIPRYAPGEPKNIPGSKDNLFVDKTQVFWCQTTYYLLQGMSSKFVNDN